MTLLSKNKLREHYRALRQRIPLAYREQAAKQAAAIFTRLAVVQTAEKIACYLPYKDEFNANAIIESIWQAKKTCFLPIVTEDKCLQFVCYEYGNALHTNAYGILEPVDTSHQVLPNALDIVITPLLAFDRLGARLGTGGGYYDRTFAFLRSDTPAEKPYLLGLGYAAQQAESLPLDPWDIKLSGIVTEQGFIFPS